MQRIEIPALAITWSDWHAWDDLKRDVRSDSEGTSVPGAAGVYEAKYCDTEERLTIGKAFNLRMRVKQGLVKGKIPHSSGDKIRVGEDTARVVIRWAETDRPAAVEEELHRQYKLRFGQLPAYTERT